MCHFKQLQLTYRPEEGPDESEDAKLPSDEPEPVPSDEVAVSSIDNASPAPPRPPQNNMDTGDLLVILLSFELA